MKTNNRQRAGILTFYEIINFRSPSNDSSINFGAISQEHPVLISFSHWCRRDRCPRQTRL